MKNENKMKNEKHNDMTTWFTDRKLKVLDYQQDVLSDMVKSLDEKELTVLAASPSSGKTIMSIYLIDRYLSENPNHKVLVLTHGTTVLRSQFNSVLNDISPSFTFKIITDVNEFNGEQVNICLPQTLRGKDIPNVDLLIVDEAHHFYFADMVQNIIKMVNPTKQICLTGTPSPFIARDIDIIPIPLNTIFDQGMVSDLHIQVATSSYMFNPSDDYNTDYELKNTIDFDNFDTGRTLDELISSIVMKLNIIEDEVFNPDWISTLNKLHKTMFACRNQVQALQVKNYFELMGINTALSISDTDRDSSEIDRFVNDEDCLVLIVVGRGILGFNYPELVNIVDMTISQNVDRIYQLMARVVRIHPKGYKKLFFKIAPKDHTEYFKFVMTAVLSLSEKEYLLKYNGRNFGSMEIPVKKVRKITTDGDYKGKSVSQGKIVPIDFELPMFSFFKDINTDGGILDVYTTTTIKDVRKEFIFTDKVSWLYDNVKESASKYNNLKDWKKDFKGAYQAAHRNGWLNDVTSHMNKLNKWTYDIVKESASKYTSVKEWIKNDKSAYMAGHRNGWLNDVTSHFDAKGRNWTYERAKEITSKYKVYANFYKNETNCLFAIKNNGWEDLLSHMKKTVKYTYENVKESSLKYKSKKEWIKNDRGFYQAALRYGWMVELSKDMICKNN